MFSKQGFITVCLVILTALLITGCLLTTPTPVAVTGVTLDQATMTLTAGGATGTLVATVAPANATNRSVTWSSSAPAVATVANGVVTPLTAGTTTITVTTVDGGFTATCAVTVNPAPVAVGDSYGGGIVAYILVNGDTGYDPSVQHGLIAATADQSTRIQWYNGSGNGKLKCT
ncbi:Ig-like domain-containing protein [bacterium]|nr:Ig-like domain-containing protein [bacterium]